jgi:hypothetical protein
VRNYGQIMIVSNQRIGQVIEPITVDAINAEFDLIHERLNDVLQKGYLFIGRKAVNEKVYSMDPRDHYIGVQFTASAVTIILPLADKAHVNKIYMVKDEGNIATTYNITITAQNGEKIDKSSTTSISSSLGVKRFFSTGAEWFTV